MQAKLTEYLQMRLEEVDMLEAIADDLGLALRQLTGPARAAIEAVEAGELDDLLEHPLQQQLFATIHALSAARMYLITIGMAGMAEAAVERIQAGDPS